MKNTTALATPIACFFEEAPLMTEVGTVIATCTVSETKIEPVSKMSYFVETDCYLVIDELGLSHAVPIENVTFSTTTEGALC